MAPQSTDEHGTDEQGTAAAGEPPHTIIGLDIGDGESTLAYVSVAGTDADATERPAVYQRKRTGERSVVTAMARDGETGRRLLGEEAVFTGGAVQFAVNFKEAPRKGQLATPDAVLFAQGMLDEFLTDSDLSMDGCVVYVGHPTGWPKESTAAYGGHFGAMGMDVRLMPESHSALVHVRDRHTGGQPWHDRVLVVDIGSSTTDCTLVEDMTPHNIDLGADLGCRQIDRELAALVKTNLKTPGFAAALAIDGGPSLLLLACRRVKEAKFSGTSPGLLTFGTAQDERFDPIVDGAFGWLDGVEIMDVVTAPGGFAERFRTLLTQVRAEVGDRLPGLVVLSGGGSRMPFVRDIACEVFPGATVEDDPEPAYSVARGLAAAGRHRVNIDRFHAEVAEIARDPAVEATVRSAVEALLAEVITKLAAMAAEDPEAAQAWAAGFSAQDPGPDAALVQRHVAALAESLSAALSPRAVRTCAAYGLDDQALTFQVTLPRLVTNNVQKLVTTTVRSTTTMSATDPRARAGVRFMDRVGELYRHRKGMGSPMSRAGKVDLAISGGILLFSAYVAARDHYRDRQAEQAAAQTPLTSVSVAPEETDRLVEAIREQLSRQLAARAEELERFLA